MGIYRATVGAVPRKLSATLRTLRHGTHDPTTIVESGSMWHATHTPAGPATIHLRWEHDLAHTNAEAQLDAAATGPGGDWLVERIDDMTGDDDRSVDFPDAPAVVRDALRRRAPVRLVASRNAYHQLLPVVLAQRITADDAIRQWHRLVEQFGSRPPAMDGMPDRLRLPPAPEVLATTASHRLHTLGIEASRARTLRVVASHADRVWEWSQTGELLAKAQLLPGIGPWTAASVARVCVADADTVIVGDFHFANSVGWHLTGRPRSTDDEMVELLADFAPQRGRVQAALVAFGSAPAFGPRRRKIPVARW